MEFHCPAVLLAIEGRKRDVYASLGVREYWLFDPTGDWLTPRLQGLRLQEGEYRRLPSVATMDGGLRLDSEALGLDVRLEPGEDLRFHDPATGRDLPGALEAHMRYREADTRHGEVDMRYRETQARLDEEAAARRIAEARIEELAARLGRSR